MDKNDNPVYLNYLIIDSSPFRLRYCSATFLPSQQPLFVAQLKALMGRNHRVDSFVDYSVYKADILVESYTSLREADIGPLLSEPLPEIARLSQHWPQGFDPGLIHVLLGNTLERESTIPSAVELNVDIPDTEVDDNEAAQLEVIKSLAKYSTSSMASIVNYKKYQENPHHRILNGRPADATGLPIGLYHPIFDSFQKRIHSIPPEVTPKQLTDTLRLITASQNIYAEEPGAQDRVEALAPILDSLLGCSVGTYETKGTKSDGSILSRNGAYCMIMDLKNEIGTGGSDPSIHGAIEFAEYWSQERLQWLREQCCCPTFILAIAGPWACILGGVMVKHPVVQPLAVFSITNNPSSESSTNTVARTFASLSLSLSELCDFYQGFTVDDPRPDHLRFYPYVRHFTQNGKRVKIQYRSQVPDRAVFGAMALPEEGEPYPIMVKFAESYHVTAHRMLAAKGLAPELLFASSEDPKESGFAKRVMVVMRRVTGSDLAITSPVPQRVLDDISSALKILHDSNLVYGDLRPPNVLAVEDHSSKITGGMLIDFDWCGTAGQAKYPWNINPAVQWPKGVTPGAIISMEHDLAMLKGLSKRVERS